MRSVGRCAAACLSTTHLATPTLEPGLVIAGHGRHVWVETPDGRRLICHPRGKKSQTVVGDQVLWQASEDEGTIEKVLPRKNLFYRQDEIRTKSFAANLDQLLILIAAAVVVVTILGRRLDNFRPFRPTISMRAR